MIFIDTNILIDIAHGDPVWADWSLTAVRQASGTEPLVVNEIVVGELAPGFQDIDTLRALFQSLSIAVSPITDDIAFLGGKRFQAYRGIRIDRRPVLPDFLIGAHALFLDARLLTRDARHYRTYFPELPLITPEDDHG